MNMLTQVAAAVEVGGLHVGMVGRAGSAEVMDTHTMKRLRHHPRQPAHRAAHLAGRARRAPRAPRAHPPRHLDETCHLCLSESLVLDTSEEHRRVAQSMRPA